MLHLTNAAPILLSGLQCKNLVLLSISVVMGGVLRSMPYSYS